jgi:predicted dehydrogenase
VLPAIAGSGNGRVVALASRSPERAKAMLADDRDAHVCDSYDSLLGEPDVDAVYIPLVNNLHREWTLRALEAGKHVLCEKPLAMNAEEAEEMASAATRAGRVLMEAFMYRFDPRIRELVAAIHQPVHVQASFGFHLTEGENYRFVRDLGGGALLDVGCYTVSVVRWVMGEPVEVLARARTERGVDMTAAALLVFEGGRTGSVWSSFESPEEQELTVVTADRVHRLDRPFTPPDNPDEPYRLMVESFADSVLYDRPAAILPSESVANMRVLDRIRAGFSS